MVLDHQVSRSDNLCRPSAGISLKLERPADSSIGSAISTEDGLASAGHIGKDDTATASISSNTTGCFNNAIARGRGPKKESRTAFDTRRGRRIVPHEGCAGGRSIVKHRDSWRGAGIARDIHDFALSRRRVTEKGNLPRTSSILPLVSFQGCIADRRIVEKLDFSTGKDRAPSAERR